VIAAAVAAPATAQPQPVRVRMRQVPGQEPPLADGLAPGVPGVRREAPHPATPVVTIRVEVESAATPGRELEYHIRVENITSSDAHHVAVRMPVPDNSKYKSARPAPAPPNARGEYIWELGTLKAGTRRDITFVVEPTGGDDVLCCARVSFEHGECVRTRIAKPSLRVRTTGPERLPVGDISPAPYVIEVTNAGSADATNVVLTEELPAGLEFSDSTPPTKGDNPLTWNLGTLAPGERRRVEFKVIAKQNGVHQLKATVSAAGIKAVEGNLSRVLVGEAKLSLMMTGPSWRSVGSPATYLLTVSNPGAIPATNVQLTDPLYQDARVRGAIEFVRASDGGRLAGDDVRWSLGTLEAGARRTVSLTLRALAASEFQGFKNAATVQADRAPKVEALVKTTFEVPSGLVLDVDKDADPVAVGKTATFTLHARQRGGSPATKVALSVALPDGLQYVDAHGKSAAVLEGRTVNFAPLGELASGDEAVYTVTVRAERPEELKVRATLTSDPLPKNGAVQREETLSVVPASASPGVPAAPAVPEKPGGK
jgi:uncharacterized repeat protein (TIGR01451 family)